MNYKQQNISNATKEGYSKKALEALAKGTYKQIRQGQIASFKRQEARKHTPAIPALKATPAPLKEKQGSPYAAPLKEKQGSKYASKLKGADYKRTPVQQKKKQEARQYNSAPQDQRVKPATRYENQPATQKKPAPVRDTKYDKDFQTYWNARFRDTDLRDYDPVTDRDVEHWRTVKSDLMKKYNWSDKEFEDKFKSFNEAQWQKMDEEEVSGNKAIAEKSKLLGALANTMYLPQSMMEGVAGTARRLIGYDNPEFAGKNDLVGTQSREAMKTEATKDMGTVGSSLYNIGAGQLDRAVASQIPVLGTAALGAETAARTLLNNESRGVDDWKSALQAFGAGAVSGYMNRWGFNKMSEGAETPIGSILKGMLAEGSEEGAEELANIGLDAAVNGKKSEIASLYDYYKGQGMSDKQAALQVVKDKGIDLATSIGTGALFGGIFSTANELPRLKSDIQAGLAARLADRTFKKNDNVRHILETGEAPVDTTDIDTFIDDTTKQANDAVNEINNLNEQIPETPVGESAPNYRWGETADSLISADSYARQKDFIELEQKIKDYNDQIGELNERRIALQKELSKERKAAKPKDQWTDAEKVNNLIYGDIPYEYSERAPELESQIDEIAKQVIALEKQRDLLDEDRDYTKAQERLKQLETYEQTGLVPATRDDYFGFDITKGGMRGDLERGKARLVEMSPEEYIRRCAYEIFKNNEPSPATLESVLSSREQASIDEYAQRMLAGEKAPTPYLNYETSNQEGLHRALAAMKAGIDVIPVMVEGNPPSYGLDWQARNFISDINLARLDRELAETGFEPLVDYDDINADNSGEITQQVYNPTQDMSWAEGARKYKGVIAPEDVAELGELYGIDGNETRFVKNGEWTDGSRKVSSYVLADGSHSNMQFTRGKDGTFHVETLERGGNMEAAGESAPRNSVLSDQDSLNKLIASKKTGSFETNNGQVFEKYSLNEMRNVIKDIKANGGLGLGEQLDILYKDGTEVKLSNGDDVSNIKLNNIDGIVWRNENTDAFYGNVSANYYDNYWYVGTGGDLDTATTPTPEAEITQPNVNSQTPNAPEMPILSDMEQTVGKIPSDNGISQDVDNDFVMLNNTGLDEPDSYTLEVPLEPGEGFRSPAGIRNTYTNTYINADIISKYEYEHNPKIQEAAKYAVANNEESYNTALNDVKKHGAEFLKGYLDGSREINTHEDVDRSMLLLQNLADQLERGEDVRAQKDLLQSRLAKAATQRGQFIQAFAKWNDTADGALFNGKGIKSARTEQWEGTHQRDVATNKRIAQKLTDNIAEWDGTRVSNGANYNPNQNANPNGTSARMDRALKQQGYDGTMDTTRTPKTHEQHRAEVENSIKKEYGSIASQLTDQDFEFATWMVENNVPVDIIVDELEHRFNHGEWYTIDESTPIKKQVSGKLASILAQMGDDTRKANNKRVPAMDEISYPAKSHATIAEEVRNTLDSDAASLGLDTDTDIEFMTTMLEEGVPRWQIEDEIRHRLATGEWYSLDESIPEPKAKNQNIRSALNALVNSGETQAKPELTREELREQIRNTLDDEHASLGEFTDEDVDYLANLIENGATTQELADALNTKLATGAFDISLDTQKKVNLLFEEASKYDPNSQEACVAKAAAYKLIADEVMGDASALEKFEAWRYVAMLGNPKTMLRNFVGNTMFNALTGTSNSFAGLVEAATDASVKAGKKASNKLFKTEFDTTKGIERRKSVLLPTTKDRGLVKSAWKDATAHRYNDITGTKYEKGVKDKIREQKSVFNSKWAKLYEKLTDAGISDTFAVRTKYSTSLAGYLKANGFDESIFDADERYRGLQEISRRRNLTDTERAQMAEDQKLHDVLEKARDYAVAQAEYATFHEDNKFASWLSKASREAPKPVQWLIEGTTPFKKTPANIVRSAEEFSPFGAINSIIKTGKLIYENTGKRKGQLADTYTTKSGKVRQKTLASDVIESWSKTLTGSALMGLGYYLSNKGILNSSEKDEQYQDELEGKQNYSITINGHTYTIDWAAPAAMTLLMGAELNKIVKRNGILDKTIYDNLSDVIGVVNTLLDPIVETSMMQGVKDTLQSAADITRYNDAADAGLGIIGTVSANAATNYLTQAVPTVLGQMARVIDPTRRSTDTVAKDSLVAGMEKQGRKLMNRLPFASMLNTPFVDARGQEQLNSPSANPLISIPYQFLSPGYLSEIKETEADKSARDVYNAKIPHEDEQGNTTYVPQMDKGVFETWKSKVTVGDHKFTPKEMYQYRTSSGQANEKIRTALANEDWFNGLDPQMQNDLLKKVNSLVDKIGLEAVGYPQDDKALDEYNSGGVPSLLDYYKQSSIKKQVQEETGLSSQSKKTTEITNAIMEGKTEEANQMIAEEVQKQEAVKPYQEPAEALGIDAQDYSYVKSYAGSSWSKVEPELPKLKELGGTNYSQYAHAVNYADSHGESISAQQFYDQTKRLDTDKSGGVSQDELINEFNAKGMKEAEVMRLWGMLALGKDGAEPKSVPHIITRGKNKGKWGR